MSEPTAQVPVPLIEQARQAYEDHGWKSDPLVSQLAILLGRIAEAAPQPTPTAEFGDPYSCADLGHVGDRPRGTECEDPSAHEETT